MRKYVVVIWHEKDTSYMSFVQYTKAFELEIIADPDIVFDRALDAQLTFPDYAVELLQQYIDEFNKLQHLHTVHMSEDLYKLLLPLVPERIRNGSVAS